MFWDNQFRDNTSISTQCCILSSQFSNVSSLLLSKFSLDNTSTCRIVFSFAYIVKVKGHEGNGNTYASNAKYLWSLSIWKYIDSGLVKSCRTDVDMQILNFFGYGFKQQKKGSMRHFLFFLCLKSVHWHKISWIPSWSEKLSWRQL